MIILIYFKNMKKFSKLIVLGLFFLALPLLAAQANNAQTGNVSVAKGEIISGNLYVAGENITIDGTVSGDLIAAAQSITVTGQVEGDIIAVSQDVVIDGVVGGSVRVIANTISINGEVARNVNSFSSEIILGPNSHIGWDVYLAAANASSQGIVDGSLNSWSNKVAIVGQIGKNVNLATHANKQGASLVVAPTAVINGDISYSAFQPITVSDGASVGGEVKQTVPQTTPDQDRIKLWIWQQAFFIFSALIVGLSLIYLAKNPVKTIIDGLETNLLKSAIPGLILFFVIPPISLILAITMIGLPLSLIITALWLISLYIGKILLAILLGKVITSKIINLTSENALFWSLIVGVIILWLLTAIPFVGWFICLIATSLGLGSIWNYVYRERQNI